MVHGVKRDSRVNVKFKYNMNEIHSSNWSQCIYVDLWLDVSIFGDFERLLCGGVESPAWGQMFAKAFKIWYDAILSAYIAKGIPIPDSLSK